MKKYFKVAFIYAIAALAMGVFFREFTKGMNFTGISSLGYIHLHLFGLGTLMFILVAILSNYLDFTKSKLFKYSFVAYNIGLPLMSVMFLVRGIITVMKIDVTKINGMISGIAGITHIVLGAAIVMMLLSFIFLAKDKKAANK